MNLFEILDKKTETFNQDKNIPAYLYGAFRRKSISFFNGLTDEKTIVYWFQSQSFTIDLRLKHATETLPIECQAWIGDTLWDSTHELLSWNITKEANYQNHTQWPEPAKLHAIGNCILEFSPNNAYVEDWRQQANQGLFLGLRLTHATHVESQEKINLHGGLIICDQFIAYAQSRLPDIQRQINAHTDLKKAYKMGVTSDQISSFEVSIGFDGQLKALSTQCEQIGKKFNFENFDILDEHHLTQTILINGESYRLNYQIDTFIKNHIFQNQTLTPQESQEWFKTEQNHLLHHSEITR